MAGRTGTDITRVEREIRAVRDPEQRAVRAVEAHRQARELAARMSALRRDAFMELHDAGRTWQEVADAVGMSLKATIKAVHGAGDPGHWWKRLPTEVADSVKRGPGGKAPTHVISRAALMSVVVEAMEEAERANRKLGRGAARISPGQLAEYASERFAKPVAMPSLRNALHTLIEQGRVARVGHGRYVLVEGNGSSRRARSGAVTRPDPKPKKADPGSHTVRQR